MREEGDVKNEIDTAVDRQLALKGLGAIPLPTISSGWGWLGSMCGESGTGCEGFLQVKYVCISVHTANETVLNLVLVIGDTLSRQGMPASRSQSSQDFFYWAVGVFQQRMFMQLEIHSRYRMTRPDAPRLSHSCRWPAT